MLKVHNLAKSFGDKKALKGVSFSIEKGEIFSLIGPNSAGKSTLVKTIIGLLAPTSGTITVNGHDVSTQTEKAKKEIGYIPDEPTIWAHMTGEEFLFFTQALYGVDEKKRNVSLSSLLDTFKLQGIEKNYFEDYSRGNKQKFSILAAMSHAPKLLLIDEPIVGLDPTGAEIAKNLFSEYAKKGGAVLLVTHTLPVAEEISHKIGFLKEGKLCAYGTLAELKEQAGVEASGTLEDVYKKLLQ